MDLFHVDRPATQRITDLSEQSVRVLLEGEATQDYPWVFEICTIEPTIRPAWSSVALLDAFLTSLQLGEVPQTYESRLHEVDRDEARKILVYILSQSLAYGSTTMVPADRVVAIVEELL
jgi:hypothetical protein